MVFLFPANVLALVHELHNAEDWHALPAARLRAIHIALGKHCPIDITNARVRNCFPPGRLTEAGGVVCVPLTFLLQFFYSSTRLPLDFDELQIVAWALTPDAMSRCEDALHEAGFSFMPFVTVDVLLANVRTFRDAGAFNSDELSLSRNDFFHAVNVLTRELTPIEWADPPVAAAAKNDLRRLRRRRAQQLATAGG